MPPLIRLIPDDTPGYRDRGGCLDCNASQIVFKKRTTIITAVTHSATCPTLTPRRNHS